MYTCITSYNFTIFFLGTIITPSLKSSLTLSPIFTDFGFSPSQTNNQTIIPPAWVMK